MWLLEGRTYLDLRVRVGVNPVVVLCLSPTCAKLMVSESTQTLFKELNRNIPATNLDHSKNLMITCQWFLGIRKLGIQAILHEYERTLIQRALCAATGEERKMDG